MAASHNKRGESRSSPGIMLCKEGYKSSSAKKPLSEYLNNSSIVPKRVEPLNRSLAQEEAPMERKDLSAYPKIRINTSFSLTTMHNVFVSFDTEKKALLDSIGFGGLLKVHKQRLQCRELLLQLLRSMDPNCGTLTLSSGKLSVKDKDVHLVLGIPLGGQQIGTCLRSEEALKKVKLSLLLEADDDLNIGVVKHILVKDYGRKMNTKEREAFKVAAVIFLDSCFLGPRGDKRRVNKEILQHVTDSATIQGSNWSDYVLRVLRNGAAKVQYNIACGHKTVVLDGCLLFLLVFYLDNLCAGFITPAHDTLPRIAKYTPRLVSELVSYDRRRRMPHSQMFFGRAKLRPRGEVIYSRSYILEDGPSETQGQQPSSTMSNPKNITPSCSDNSYLSLNMNPVDQRSKEFNEAQLVLEEYIQIFRRQVNQATNELKRKVHNLLGNIGGHSSPPLQMLGEIEGYIQNHEPSNSTTSRLGQKASTRRFYMTVASSHSGSIDRGVSSKFCNVEPDELLAGKLLSSPLNVNKVDGYLTTYNEKISKVLPEPNMQSDAKECNKCSDSPISGDLMVFGPSPFSLDLRDKDLPVKSVIEVIRILPKFRIEERKCPWFTHNEPTKLEIDGETLYHAFYEDVEFNYDIMDATMRLYNDLDDELYEGIHEKRWRHYLPASLAVIVLEHTEKPISDVAKIMLTTGHLSHNFHVCQLVFLPVLVGSHWSLYAWDFGMKQVTIFDPLISEAQHSSEKHNQTATQLLRILVACKIDICSDSCCIRVCKNWRFNYVAGDEPSHSEKSGLYAIFFSRFFDGQVCTRTMVMDDSVTLFQTSLLCQLLLSKCNKGGKISVVQGGPHSKHIYSIAWPLESFVDACLLSMSLQADSSLPNGQSGSKVSKSSDLGHVEGQLSGYDGDDEYGKSTLETQPSMDSEGGTQSSIPLDAETGVSIEPLSMDSTLVLEEGAGDSGTEAYTPPLRSPSVLAEGDSSSTTSTPVRIVDDVPAPRNLRRRRVFVESDSAKRSRLDQ